MGWLSIFGAADTVVLLSQGQLLGWWPGSSCSLDWHLTLDIGIGLAPLPGSFSLATSVGAEWVAVIGSIHL